MSRFKKIFPSVNKPLIAMAHVPPLPGTPLYDAAKGVQGLIDHVKRDTEELLKAGFDAILFCNEGDRPYQLNAGLEASAVMTRVVTECRPTDVPYGVDFLWDEQCAMAIAVGSSAYFMREVITGTWESDMGLWQPDAAKLLRNRRAFGRDDLAIFANITPEFASNIGQRTPAQMAKSTVVSSLPDVILVSGPMAGSEPDVRTVADVREAVEKDIPVLLDTGAKSTTIKEFFKFADGCIVGIASQVLGIVSVVLYITYGSVLIATVVGARNNKIPSAPANYYDMGKKLVPWSIVGIIWAIIVVLCMTLPAGSHVVAKMTIYFELAAAVWYFAVV